MKLAIRYLDAQACRALAQVRAYREYAEMMRRFR